MGKTRVILPAQVVEVRRKSDVVSTRRQNDSRVLTEIQFRRRPWCCRAHRAR
jgi:hypothetical protein